MTTQSLLPPNSSDDVVVIAEAGVNHNGDAETAHRLIDVAKFAGADAVKFQTFDTAQLTSVSAELTPYQRRRADHASQAALLRQLTLPKNVWGELASHAAQAGIQFLSTPFDWGSAQLLVDLGVEALKVSSGELTNIPFLRQLATVQLPLLVSTGMGSLEEVGAAVEACMDAPGLGLFHCVSAYPAPIEECNLRAIPSMVNTFGLTVGWSDHTVGTDSAVVAASLGARLFEKHFTLSRDLPGPDHAASLEPAELADYVTRVRAVPTALGDGIKRAMPTELENRSHVRRSWHTRRPIAEGQTLGPEDIHALRPATGIAPTENLEGRRVSRSLPAGSVIQEDDLA